MQACLDHARAHIRTHMHTLIDLWDGIPATGIGIESEYCSEKEFCSARSKASNIWAMLSCVSLM